MYNRCTVHVDGVGVYVKDITHTRYNYYYWGDTSNSMLHGNICGQERERARGVALCCCGSAPDKLATTYYFPMCTVVLVVSRALAASTDGRARLVQKFQV